MVLEKNSKIYVAGHHGLVGSAIWNNLLQRGYINLVGCSHKELDLTDQVAVMKFFDEELPVYEVGNYHLCSCGYGKSHIYYKIAIEKV